MDGIESEREREREREERDRAKNAEHRSKKFVIKFQFLKLQRTTRTRHHGRNKSNI